MSASLEQDRISREDRDPDHNRASAEEVRAVSLLYNLSNLCARVGDDFEECLNGILDAAMSVTRADKATLQLVEPVTDALAIVAQRGFDESFLKFFDRVSDDTAAVCAAAKRTGQRVVVEDIKTSPLLRGSPALEVLAAANIRAVQSTPLVSADGPLLGIISTHFGHPRVPDEQELKLMDLLARQAANYLDRRKSDEASLRLAAIVDHCDDAIASKDLNGTVWSWNKAAEQIFGYTAAEMIGKSIMVLIPGDRQGEEADILSRIRRGERIDHYETVRRRKDGALINVSLTISPLKNSAGRIIGASKIARDITEHKRLEQQQRALYDLISAINRAPDLSETCSVAVQAVQRSQGADCAAVLICDHQGVMRFRASTGLSEEYRRAVEGHSPWKPDDLDPQPVLINDVSKAGLSEHLRMVVEREGIGSLAFIPLAHQRRLQGKFMIYYKTPHQFTADEIRPALTIASQVVHAIERQQSEEAMERLVNDRTASLREAIAQMEEFSYTVSHDLRAPLRAMEGYSQTLLQDFSEGLPDEARYCLQRIAFNAKRLDKMVLDVLTFSKVARAEFTLEKVAVENLARQIVEQYPGMQSPNAEVRIESLPDVLGHEPSLTQAFSNLLNNAVKFVAPGVTPKIRVWSERNSGSVRIWVEDNGIGIDPRYQHRLFRMFERVHPDLKYDGTGVGLAVVRKAVERMGGKVGVESDGVNGSRFWIEVRGAQENGHDRSNNIVG